MDTKRCSRCKELKDQASFSKNTSTRDGLQNICRECNKEYRRNNIPPERERNWKLKNKYGITLEQYDQMLQHQDGRCKICGVHQSNLSKPLVVDHDHKSSTVRALLCNECNLLLGYARDRVDLLAYAIDYLGEFA